MLKNFNESDKVTQLKQLSDVCKTQDRSLVLIIDDEVYRKHYDQVKETLRPIFDVVMYPKDNTTIFFKGSIYHILERHQYFYLSTLIDDYLC